MFSLASFSLHRHHRQRGEYAIGGIELHGHLPRRLEEGGEPRAVLTLSGRLVLVDRVVADAGLAQSIPLQVEALGTVRLRYPRVADQHWRLQNDRFCDT